MRKKIMLVFGTRPEAIKMAPLYNKLSNDSGFDLITCVTGQHRNLLDQVLNVFSIKADFDLNLMNENQDLFDITSKVVISMKNVLQDTRPDIVLVHGDTTTTMAAALAAFYMNIDVGHVEAGLRTHNLRSPFPEELNRQLVSKIANWHFAPTERNKNDLIAEGIDQDKIFVTGNTVIDALFLCLNNISKSKKLTKSVNTSLSKQIPFSFNIKNFILITAHRRENFGESFMNIFRAIKDLSINFKNMHFVYPVHPNPNVKDMAHEILSEIDNVHLIKPVSYEEFCILMKNCYLVITDSGGIQEEAPSIGKPVLVLRENTERPEAIVSGTARLVGSSRKKIVNNVTKLIKDKEDYNKMSNILNPYGDGTAAEKIIQKLKEIYD